MATYNKDISSYTTMVIPRSIGVELAIPANWYAMYPSGSWWGQFIILHDGVNSILLYINDSQPEVQDWHITPTNLSITTTSDTPVNVVEYTYSGTDWKVGAEEYKNWAKQQYWYARRGAYKDIDYCHSSGQWDGTNLKSRAGQEAAKISNYFIGNKVGFFGQYRTELFDELYPDYTVDTTDLADVGFKIAKDAGVIVCPYVNFNWWSSDEAGYDYTDMMWEVGKDVITSITESTGTYTFSLSNTPLPDLPVFTGDVAVGDHFTITGSTNTSANEKLFVVTSYTSNTNFVCTSDAGIGTISDGLIHWIVRHSSSPEKFMQLKKMCPTAQDATNRLLTEIDGIIDSDSQKTSGIYLDTLAATHSWTCYNPNHSHSADTSRNYILETRKKAKQFKKDFILGEGYGEVFLDLADAFLWMDETGTKTPSGTLVPLFNYIYGSICTHIGWDKASNPTLSDTDAEWAALIDENNALQQKGNASFNAHIAGEIDIFSGTWTLSTAKFKSNKITKKISNIRKM